MTPLEAKRIIKKLGLRGVGFSELLKVNKNYVTNFNRDGVPQNIAIILKMSEKLLEKGVDREDIISLIKKEVESFLFFQRERVSSINQVKTLD